MDARIDFFGNAPVGKVLKDIDSANKVVRDSALPFGDLVLPKGDSPLLLAWRRGRTGPRRGRGPRP
ncbi:hypothetical protein ACFXAE_04195 [Streptomyces sp. NPDC059454]|uniref:hypothetical protein n=1 Tax=Streptomyces sp. NPDC059454 TaxID=3346836 RepID=UPI0036BD6028